MKRPAFHIAAALAVALFQCSCVQPHHAAFSEAAFAPFLRSGTGILKGKAILILKDGSTWTASSNAVVKLMPANAYTDEIADQHFGNRVTFEPPDPRFAKYVRKIHTDDQGNFAFTHLAPGDYWLSCRLYWTDTVDTTDANDEPTTEEIQTSQFIYGLFTIRNGVTSTVTEWRQGYSKSR